MITDREYIEAALAEIDNMIFYAEVDDYYANRFYGDMLVFYKKLQEGRINAAEFMRNHLSLSESYPYVREFLFEIFKLDVNLIDEYRMDMSRFFMTELIDVQRELWSQLYKIDISDAQKDSKLIYNLNIINTNMQYTAQKFDIVVQQVGSLLNVIKRLDKTLQISDVSKDVLSLERKMKLMTSLAQVRYSIVKHNPSPELFLEMINDLKRQWKKVEISDEDFDEVSGIKYNDLLDML